MSQAPHYGDLPCNGQIRQSTYSTDGLLLNQWNAAAAAAKGLGCSISSDDRHPIIRLEGRFALHSVKLNSCRRQPKDIS
jgi:hypothetical protein